MHRPGLEQEHEMFRDSVRKFIAEELKPNMEAWRELGCVDRYVFKKAGDLGFLMLWAEEQYGGMGIDDFRYDQVLIEELGLATCADVFLPLHSRLVGPYLGKLGNEEQKSRLLTKCVRGESILGVAMTEPGAGSDLAGMKTHAKFDGENWILNGSKTFISNGIIGDVFVVAARTNPEKSHAVGLFLVERGMNGFARGRNLKKMGLKAQDTAELFFDDVAIPPENVLGDSEKGFYNLMGFLVEERLMLACGSLANAQAALKTTIEYTQERNAFGQPLAAFQNTRFKFADMQAKLDAAQAYADYCVSERNAGRLDAAGAAKLKLFVSELEGQVVDECVQLHGGHGYMQEYDICHMYTDARISRIYGGTSEIMREIISRDMGLDYRKQVSAKK